MTIYHIDLMVYYYSPFIISFGRLNQINPLLWKWIHSTHLCMVGHLKIDHNLFTHIFLKYQYTAQLSTNFRC